MELSTKILSIATDMGLPVIHGTAEQLAVLVDTVKTPCCALLDYGSSTMVQHGPQRVEQVALCAFFLERVSPSFSPDETQAVYERMRRCADDFLDRVHGVDDPTYSTLRVDGDARYDRVNLRYKGVYGGIMVTATVIDLQGFCAPSSIFSDL